MPFINGRYHINPAIGQALEDARSAAEEVLASDDSSHSTSDDSVADRADSSDDKGPIHHIEIEAAETVPAHSGRAARGFIARVHRALPGASRSQGVASPSALRPETHVFTDHGDLLDFLRNELSKDCARA